MPIANCISLAPASAAHDLDQICVDITGPAGAGATRPGLPSPDIWQFTANRLGDDIVCYTQNPDIADKINIAYAASARVVAIFRECQPVDGIATCHHRTFFVSDIIEWNDLGQRLNG